MYPTSNARDEVAAGEAAGRAGGADQSALDDLYREQNEALVRQLTRRTGCRETALELAQEAFVRLLRMTPERFQAISRPASYLRVISANIARDNGRRRALDLKLQEQLGPAEEPRIDQVVALESRDTLRRLEAAMEKLKPRTREIFLAHRIEGLSYAEIAERTGLSMKGVEKQMSKAIAMIDRFLSRQ